MIGQNLDPIVYRDVLAQLLNRLEMRNNHQIDDKLWKIHNFVGTKKKQQQNYPIRISIWMTNDIFLFLLLLYI